VDNQYHRTDLPQLVWQVNRDVVREPHGNVRVFKTRTQAPRVCITCVSGVPGEEAAKYIPSDQSCLPDDGTQSPKRRILISSLTRLVSNTSGPDDGESPKRQIFILYRLGDCH